MYILNRPKLASFFQKHQDAKKTLESWVKETEVARWCSFSDIKERYQSADVLKDNRVVFNVKGNNYRLIVKVNYSKGIVDIRFVGTHSEYDRVNAEKI